MFVLPKLRDNQIDDGRFCCLPCNHPILSCTYTLSCSPLALRLALMILAGSLSRELKAFLFFVKNLFFQNKLTSYTVDIDFL